MYLLDTDVATSLNPMHLDDPDLASWLSSIPPEQTFLSTVTIVELEHAVLDAGGEATLAGRYLRSFLDFELSWDFADRILTFDPAAAAIYATMPMRALILDRWLMIGAIARANDMTIVTRRELGFLPTGAKIVNPVADRFNVGS